MNEEQKELMIIKEEKSKSINYLAVLNVIAAIAVIIQHVKGGDIERFSTSVLWRNINIIEGIVHFGVPVFFMISGATLLDYSDRYSTKEFLKKRFKKQLFLFCFGVL